MGRVAISKKKQEELSHCLLQCLSDNVTKEKNRMKKETGRNININIRMKRRV